MTEFHWSIRDKLNPNVASLVHNLLGRGESETSFDSDPYQDIIKSGRDAVPILIDVLLESPEKSICLGYVLPVLTGEPAPEGPYEDQAKYWIDWFRRGLVRAKHSERPVVFNVRLYPEERTVYSILEVVWKGENEFIEIEASREIEALRIRRSPLLVTLRDKKSKCQVSSYSAKWENVEDELLAAIEFDVKENSALVQRALDGLQEAQDIKSAILYSVNSTGNGT